MDIFSFFFLITIRSARLNPTDLGMVVLPEACLEIGLEVGCLRMDRLETDGCSFFTENVVPFVTTDAYVGESWSLVAVAKEGSFLADLD